MNSTLGIVGLFDVATALGLAKHQEDFGQTLLISTDGETTAIRIDLQDHPELEDTKQQRDRLLADAKQGRDVAADLAQAEERVQQPADDGKARQQRTIDAVRAVRDRHAGAATMYLGGVPMVAADMVEFVRAEILKSMASISG